MKCITGNPPLNETSWYCVDCSDEAINSTPENQATKNASPKKSKALVKKSIKVTPTKKKGKYVVLFCNLTKNISLEQAKNIVQINSLSVEIAK